MGEASGMARRGCGDSVAAQRLDALQLVVEGGAQRFDQQQFGDELRCLPGELRVAALCDGGLRQGYATRVGACGRLRRTAARVA